MRIQFNKESSNIKAVDYSKSDRVLTVRFKKATYQYLDVPSAVVDALITEVNVKDKSLGKVFKDLIIDTDLDYTVLPEGSK